MDSSLSISTSSSQNIYTQSHTIIPLSSVARNSFLLFGFQLLTKILGFISSVVLANYFGAQAFGVFNYAFALTALFIPLCDVGMDMFLLREIPRVSIEHASLYTKNVLRIKILTTFAVFIFILLIVGGLESFSSEHFTIVILAGLVTLLRTYWTTFSSVLRAINKVQTEALLYSITRIIEFLAIVSTVYLHRGMQELLVFISLINLIAVIYTFALMRKRFLPRIEKELLVTFKQIFMGGLPFAMTGMLVTIYFNLDTVLVSKMINEKAAGVYRAAYNLILPLTMVTASISSAVFPFVSQHYKEEREQVNKIVQRSMNYLLMTSLPVAFITTILAHNIVDFLFEPEYSIAATSLLILVWFLPIAYLTNLFGNVLGAMDMQSFVLKVAAINVVVNIVANILLIPHYAQNGAAVVTVLTELVGFSFLMTKMRTQFLSLFNLRQVGKIFLSCGVAALFLFMIPEWHVLLLLTFSILIYGIALIATKALSFYEIKQTLALLKGVK